MWIVEDRKQRNILLNKNEIKINSPILARDAESKNVSLLSDGSFSGYESFPEFDEELGNNEPSDISEQHRYGL